jgi:hypothetical protein
MENPYFFGKKGLISNENKKIIDEKKPTSETKI